MQLVLDLSQGGKESISVGRAQRASSTFPGHWPVIKGFWALLQVHCCPHGHPGWAEPLSAAEGISSIPVLHACGLDSLFIRRIYSKLYKDSSVSNKNAKMRRYCHGFSKY